MAQSGDAAGTDIRKHDAGELGGSEVELMVADAGHIDADGIEDGDVRTSGAFTEVAVGAGRIESEQFTERDLQGCHGDGVVAGGKEGPRDEEVTGGNGHRGVHGGIVLEAVDERGEAGCRLESQHVGLHIGGMQDLKAEVVVFRVRRLPCDRCGRGSGEGFNEPLALVGGLASEVVLRGDALRCEGDVKESPIGEVGEGQIGAVPEEKVSEDVLLTREIALDAGRRNARSAKLETGDRAGWKSPRPGGHGPERACPGVVGVSGEHHQLLAQTGGGLQERFTLAAVPIPGIRVVRERVRPFEGRFFVRCERNARGPLDHRSQVSGDGRRRDGSAGQFDEELGWHGHVAHQHLLPKYLPGRRRGRHAPLQPLELFSAEQGSLAGVHRGHVPSDHLVEHDRCECVAEAGDACGIAGAGRRGETVGRCILRQHCRRPEDRVDATENLVGCRSQFELAIPGGEAGLQHVQRQQVAEVKGSIGLPKVPSLRFADRLPLVVGSQGGGHAVGPGTFRQRVVVLGTAAESIIGGFVVVPDHDERGGRPRRLKLRCPMILGIALTIIGEGHAFAIWLEALRFGQRFRLRIATTTVFVDVIANVQKGIVVTDAGGLEVGVEWVGGDVGTTEDRQADAGDISGGQSLGPTGLGHHGTAVGGEAVVVDRARNEAGRDHLDGIISRRVGGDCSGDELCVEGRRGRDRPTYGDRAGGVRGRSGPQDDRVGGRVAGGDTVDKAGGGCYRETGRYAHQ